MARSELGNKYTCQVCSMKFYDLNRELSMCPCGDVKIADAIGNINEPNRYEPLILKNKSKKDAVIENIEEEEKQVEALDESIDVGVIEDEDNPILMDDEDIIDDENEDELIKSDEIDIPEIEADESLIDGDDDFLVVEDDIEDPELIIKPKSKDE
mgnify:CR=1 FL=1